ncbi:hypothetical protein LR021_06180 [Candidatus Bipolaricaulota bacterium]|nr:hypothetical protein [Candidatus Bipolaricaulota bacterium]
MGDIRRAASHEVRLSESTGESEHIDDKGQMVVEMFTGTSQAAAVPGTSALLLD